MNTAPVTVGIPTYARGKRVTATIARIRACSPAPDEIIVHVDESDGRLEGILASEFPGVRCLSSTRRVGPGGGRHRCIVAASHPHFASFDDDSWPIDADYFARLLRVFATKPQVAAVVAVVSHRDDHVPESMETCDDVVEFVGCAYAIRTAVYRQLPGHIDRAIGYGIEELDVSIQLHAAGWSVLRCRNLRVFHDTTLGHHGGREITAGTIENAALIAWLRYPLRLWPYAVLQYANVLRFMIVSGRLAGVLRGVARTPIEIWKHRRLRGPVSSKALWSFLKRRAPSKQRRELLVRRSPVDC